MLKKTTILFLITGLDTGGAEVLLLRHCLYLKNKSDYDFRVVSLSLNGEIEDKMRYQGINVVSIGSTLRYNPILIWKLWKQIREYHPHILHCHLFHANLLGRFVGTVARVPKIISTIHNEHFGGLLREKLIKYTNFLASDTVVISHAIANALIKKGIVVRESITIVPNGIDVTQFQSANEIRKKEIRERLFLPVNKKIFIAVGRLREQKGYPYLLEAVKEFKEYTQNFLVLILGEGEERTQMERYIHLNSLADVIKLCGNQSNVHEYLSASDVFIMPSLWEGLPIALLEAAATGLSVIATDVGGIREVVTGDGGRLLSPRSSKEIYDAMRRAIEAEPHTLIMQGQHNRTRVENQFSQEKMFSEYNTLYHS